MLRVSSNHRFIVHDDGTPFFYLGDTAWELFHRLTLPEAQRYLRDRAAKRFTVIQAVALAGLVHVACGPASTTGAPPVVRGARFAGLASGAPRA